LLHEIAFKILEKLVTIDCESQFVLYCTRRDLGWIFEGNLQDQKLFCKVQESDVHHELIRLTLITSRDDVKLKQWSLTPINNYCSVLKQLWVFRHFNSGVEGDLSVAGIRN
jgi:hypothetical protein